MNGKQLSKTFAIYPQYVKIVSIERGVNRGKQFANTV